jgi:hypothetical protein
MKNALQHKIAPHIALGLINGSFVLAATGGHVNHLLLALVALVVMPTISLTVVHMARAIEKRQLEDAYNQPAYGEDQ